jgi:hypothetical protein
VDYRTIITRIGAGTTLLLILVFASQTIASAGSAGRPEFTRTPSGIVAESPSPSLGATPQPNRPLPGSSDSDPDDRSGIPWVIAAAVTAVVAVSGVTYILFRGGRLTWRRQDETE